MARYIALVDGRSGSYGLTVPDLPGCTSAAATIDTVLRKATEAVRLNDGPITCYLLPSRFPVSRPRWHRLRRSHYREPSGNLAHPQPAGTQLVAALPLSGNRGG